MLHDKGTNRRAFMLGQVDKYTWKDTGSSFGLSDVLAAYLLAQLEQREVIQGKRRAVHEHYLRSCSPPLAEELDFEVMQIPDGRGTRRTTCSTCCCPTGTAATTCSSTMRKEGVHATFHYLPLHLSDAGRSFTARPTECPVSEDISGRLLRLPFYNNLSAADLDRGSSTFVDVARRSRAGTRLEQTSQPGSSSLGQPDYWWYRARADLLRAGARVLPRARPAGLLDVGSADGPERGLDARRPPARDAWTSIPEGWSRARASAARRWRCRSRDGSLRRGRRLRRGRALRRTTRCALSELRRVLAPGGRMLLSGAGLPVGVVGPRRPGRAPPPLHPGAAAGARSRRAGLEVLRATYAFAAVFPLFVAERLARRRRERRGAAPPRDRAAAGLAGRSTGLLTGVSRAEARLLRHRDLPFGSSVFLAARRPGA